MADRLCTYAPAPIALRAMNRAKVPKIITNASPSLRDGGCTTMFALELHEFVIMVYVSASDIKRRLAFKTLKQKLFWAGLDMSSRA